MNANLRNFALWVIIVLLLLALFTLFQNPGQRASSQDISFSQLLTEVDQNHVRDVVIQGPEIHGTFTNGSSFQTYAPNDPTLVSRLYNGKVQITAKPPGDNVPWFVSLLVSWLPFIALIGVWIFLSRQMQGGAGKAMGFGKSRAKMLTEAHGRVTFEDVAGVDEAKQDLQEIVEFLRDPGKFQRLGGKIPRGVLLVGPPGTGKTLIARAACATCSSRPRRTRPASSSSTRSTPSAAIAAPASAAAMTSASRRSISCWSRWTALKPTKASFSSPRPTGPTCSIRRCCVPAVSTAKSWCRIRTWSAANRF